LSDAFPAPFTSAEANAWLQTRIEDPGPEHQFAIEIDGHAAGGIGLKLRTDVQAKTVGLGYWLGESYWGQGYATEALRALVPYAFETFDCHKLDAHHFGWNPASGRVLEKAGFRLEGCLREHVCKRGEFTDSLQYGLLREEAF
jgi:RimJ/RimL family protein N-acetyltransferase